MAETLDTLFREALAAIDAGDVAALERQIAEDPRLVTERLDTPGAWLRNTVGNALDGLFARPYLLWFVAEDPVRAGTLPPNLAPITQAIIDAARRTGTGTLQEQVDYALQLVCWSSVAPKCGVQLALIDVLTRAGASLERAADNALVNNNVAAAEHVVSLGAPLTLSVALSLGRWEDAGRLALAASTREKQHALVLAALHGRAEAVRRAVDLGAHPSERSEDLYSHATPLHHAVGSGSLEAVRALVEAGADLAATDTAWNGTPLDWAQHYIRNGADDDGPYPRIAAYLREQAVRR